MAGKADEIVFEDLHGVDDDREVEVNIDLSDEEDGITLVDDDESSYEEGDDDTDDTSSGAADDGDDDGDQDGGADGEDRDRFSKKFNQRLERERRAKQAEKKRADDAEAKLKAFRKKAAEDRTADVDAEIARLSDEEKDVESELEAAFEKGDSKTQARLTSRLMTVKARRERLDAQKDAGFGFDDEADDAPDNSTPQVNELAEDWKEANSDWFGRTGFERYTRMANRMDRELFAEGFDPQSEEYFEELDTRMREKAPKLFDETDDGDDGEEREPTRGKRGKSPVAPASKESSGSDKKSGSKNRVRITAEDKANIRRFGLDPTDPAVLKEYAANKRQSEAAL